MENKTIIYDALTKQTIERELTADELAEIQLSIEASELEEQAKADAKASALAKLAALGLTEEEVAAL